MVIINAFVAGIADLIFVDSIAAIITLLFFTGFIYNQYKNRWEVFGLKYPPREVGDRFYSRFFASYGTVTRYDDEDNWWYRLDGSSEVNEAEGHPKDVRWLKRDI